MLEYGKSGIYNNNRLPAEKKKEEKEKENTRDRSVPDGSDNHFNIISATLGRKKSSFDSCVVKVLKE